MTGVLPDVQVRLRDCYQNYLMDAWTEAVESGFPQNPVGFLGQLLTGPPVALEPEIYCPRGGYLELFVRGGASLSLLNINLLTISLYGVKRYKECNRGGVSAHFDSAQGQGELAGYRPQFAYATPPGCRDEDFVYYFDGSNVPLLAQNIGPGMEIDYIPLPLDQDAPFYWRGWKVAMQFSPGIQ